jgi:hypothetical protein
MIQFRNMYRLLKAKSIGIRTNLTTRRRKISNEKASRKMECYSGKKVRRRNHFKVHFHEYGHLTTEESHNIL